MSSSLVATVAAFLSLLQRPVLTTSVILHGHHSSASCSHAGDSCPPALFCDGDNCTCGKDYPNIMQCNGTMIFLRGGYCVTFDSRKNIHVAGYCTLTVAPDKLIGHSALNSVYYPVSNSATCAFYNRTGALCGRCLSGHYPLVYSYYTTCIPCPNVKWNWFKYLMAAYLPLTLFYVIILFFKINTTSSHLFPVVYYCQTLSMPPLLRLIFVTIMWNFNKSYVMPLLKVLASLYGMWNLDFFRPFYSDLCLGIGILPTLALDYSIALYPWQLLTY